ncbi:MAG: 23S rRNA (adenine(2503)-C(2))-methyltransferase RlmN [Candidatus Cloacimonadaceae bacterium]
MPRVIYSVHPDDLQAQILAAGFKAFRFRQLMQWLYFKAINDLAAMTDLSADFKQFLTENYSFALPEIVQSLTAKDKSTKFVLKLADGELIECVLMPEGEKNTLCISSQVGCAFGCVFCATGKLGAIRDLTVDEIVAQIIIAKQFLKDEKLTNLVFMGMGEPLDNLENVVPAIRILQSDYGLQFSPRRMTVSTSGYVPKMYELAETGIRVKLAVSLNSAINDKRDEIMPINKMYNLSDLKKAILSFRKQSPWRITLEYIMIPDFNMGEEDVRALLKFAGDISCKLNLIPYNEVEGFPWRSPALRESMAFQDRLRGLPIAAIIRKSRGTDISAACGQLAAQNKVAQDSDLATKK